MIDYTAEIEIELALPIWDIGDETPKYITVDVWLCCTHHYVPAFTNGPPELCYPAEMAEFEFDHFSIRGRNFGWAEFRAIFGEAFTDDIFEAACDEAVGTGDF